MFLCLLQAMEEEAQACATKLRSNRSRGVTVCHLTLPLMMHDAPTPPAKVRDYDYLKC